MCGDGKQSLRPIVAKRKPRSEEELHAEARALWEKTHKSGEER